jgi:hypothetical protein
MSFMTIAGRAAAATQVLEYSSTPSWNGSLLSWANVLVTGPTCIEPGGYTTLTCDLYRTWWLHDIFNGDLTCDNTHPWSLQAAAGRGL